MRLIDADKMLAEVKEVAYDVGENAVTYTDILNVLRNWVCRQSTVEAYGQWVSVEDRLPEENGEYIVSACDEDGPYDERIWGDTVIVCVEYCDGAWTWQHYNDEYDLDGIVTHWMPMPEPPGVEEWQK